MTGKIFRGIFFTSIIVMISCLIFVIGVQYQFYADGQEEALEQKAYLVKSGIENSDTYLDSIKKCEERITIIAQDGKVIYDNKAKASEMENHISRKEIAEAIENGTGSSVRFSNTLSKETCYYAVTLDNKEILRISHERLTPLAMIPQLLQPICAVIIAAVVISLIFASVISKHILKPINKIDIENPEIEAGYDELSPFINKIKLQNRRIAAQIQTLNQSRTQFNVISDNMNEGLVLTDKRGTILSYNKSIKKFFNTNDNLDGKNILTLNRSVALRETLDKVYVGERCDNTLELDNKIYDIIGSPVFDDSNVLCGTVILVVDITEKQKRESLRREFTANVSHELKTPLTSIYGIADMIQSGMINQNDIKGFAEDITKESGRLINLVNDIIRLSQLDENNVSEESATVNLKAVCEDVVKRITPVAQKEGIKLNCDLQDCFLNAQYSMVFEMIYNLCDNAIKYNQEKGSVNISVGTNTSEKHIIVSDTGIGIPKEDLERVFERFYRVDKSRSKHSGGTGLGLSIVKHIVLYTGGKISVKSSLGKGTEIKIIYNI